jgi:hypothetical protein
MSAIRAKQRQAKLNKYKGGAPRSKKEASKAGKVAVSAAVAEVAVALKNAAPEYSLTTTSKSLSNSHRPPLPVGFILGNHNSSSDVYVAESGKDGVASKEKKVYNSAMAMATAPGKQMLMTCFMLWMSGSSLQIFSIMMLGMAFWTPLQKIFAVNTQFQRYDGSNVNILQPKLIYIGLNLLALSVAAYKANTLGLMPSPMDILAAPTVVRRAREFSAML